MVHGEVDFSSVPSIKFDMQNLVVQEPKSIFHCIILFVSLRFLLIQK